MSTIDGMVGDQQREVDFATLMRVVWSQKVLISLLVFLGGLTALIIGFVTPPVYRAEVVVAEVHDQGMGDASSLARQLSGLASIAGIDISGSAASRQNWRAVLGSRRLSEEFVVRNDVVSKLTAGGEEPPTLWFGVEEFREEVLSIEEDTRKGTITIMIDWTDPAVAATWANGFVALANELIRARALEESSKSIAYLNARIAETSVLELKRVMYNLVEREMKTLMLANARTEYAFTVVDPAVKPEVKAHPRRALLLLTGLLAGGFLGVLLALLRHAIRRSRVRA